MRLGIDLDGIVTDFNQGWMDIYNREFGADLTPDLVDGWNAMYGLTGFSVQEFWRWARGGDRPTIFRHLPTYDGALETLQGLARAHDIVIITTKPRWAVSDTFAWIAENDVPTREVHMTSKKYLVDCDVYLEDSPHQVTTLVKRRPDDIVCRFVRPWNDPIDGAIDVGSWDDFVSLLASLDDKTPAQADETAGS